MAEVRMTIEEYAQLVEAFSLAGGSSPEGAKKKAKRLVAERPRRRKGKKDPKMARALKKANAMGRKKSGGFKKGWSQGKIMSKAHQLRRKM